LKNLICIFLASSLFNMIFQYAPGEIFRVGDVFIGGVVFFALYLFIAKLLRIKELDQFFLVVSERFKSFRNI
jgi:hypothetical protein